MASTTPHCSVTATKTYQNNNNNNHHYPQNHRRQQNPHPHHNRFSLPPRSSPSPRHIAPPCAAAASPSSTTGSLSRAPNLFPLPARRYDLSPAFSGRRSTRFVSKMHFGRPKSNPSSRHTCFAEEALQRLRDVPGNGPELDDLMLGFEAKLSGTDDYVFLLREIGNTGDFNKSLSVFDFAVKRERRKNEQGKLATAMISILGRLGRVTLAQRVFETAWNEGYGNTVYAFSAIISVYGRSGYSDEAIRLYVSMKDYGLRPNLVTYNAVIDACAKGGVEFNRVIDIFDEMLRSGVQPDQITFNSLLSVCSRGGLWKAARDLFHDMVDRGIESDIFTYNTLLDAICKGGQMDLAFDIMMEMAAKKMVPNVVTYSTVMDGYAKAGRLEDAVKLYNEMKCLGLRLDRVCYNTLLSVYAKLGKFDEALGICKEMEQSGLTRDAVTYNALLGGYGKQCKFDDVRQVFEDMKANRVSPNLLTYSTLIDVYSKGGRYKEAMRIYTEFKCTGLKADVVLYSALIDALCKNGMVETAVSLLDEMTKEGIRPNVVTYNSIIDAFGRSATAEYLLEGNESSDSKADTKHDLADEGDNLVLKIFGRLATEEGGRGRRNYTGSQEFLCILQVFHKMHELKIKPNVVTFSAILNACSRCNSFEDASMLLEELRLFDNQVYGVAHGLLMGYLENVWVQAQSLFDKVKLMDTPTASAFYNALTDMLWHFGQKRGAQMVVLEGKQRQVWENVWSDSCLDLHLMSSGAARAMVHEWLLTIRSVVFKGHELPKLLSILTGWGKHSKVVGDGTLKRAIEALLTNMGAPFRVSSSNLGRFISTGAVVDAWLRQSGTLNVLVLHDDRNHAERNSRSNLQLLPM